MRSPAGEQSGTAPPPPSHLAADRILRAALDEANNCGGALTDALAERRHAVDPDASVRAVAVCIDRVRRAYRRLGGVLAQIDQSSEARAAPDYACATEGCALADCENCRAVAHLLAAPVPRSRSTPTPEDR